MKMCSETSAHKIRTPVNNPEESIQHLEHGESLKSRKVHLLVSELCIYQNARCNDNKKMDREIFKFFKGDANADLLSGLHIVAVT